jgi:signal transduction histidine kinase
MQQANDNFYTLLLIATAGVVLLAALIILLVIVSRNRALRQERIMQQAALSHQKTLVQAIVESQEKERNYIGRELHDNVINSIMLLNLLIDKEDKSSALQLSAKVLTDIRSVSHGLSPAALRLFGLPEALSELAEQLQETTPISVDLHIEEEKLIADIPYETVLHLYRIVQELVTNTLKYANAQNVRIELKTTAGNLLLYYSDDGGGFDYNNSKLHHNGMYNIESRLQVIQATHSFSSASGKGMQMQVILPLFSQKNIPLQ